MPEIFLITGTRKGIGKGLALHYLNLGFRVIGCSRGPVDIQHAQYQHFQLDVADESAIVDMVKNVSKSYGKIDILLNNAGIASMNHILLTPGKTVRQIFSTNVFGSFYLMREIAKVMTRQKYGRIINFSTVAYPLQLEGEAIYAASKAAIESLTSIAARELGGTGITVNAVGPTPVPTDLIRNIPEEKINALLRRQAIHRYGTVDDIINVIDFFIDVRSDFITGQTIYLGGICR